MEENSGMEKLSREKSHLATKKAYREGIYSREENIVFRDGLIVKNGRIFSQANVLLDFLPRNLILQTENLRNNLGMEGYYEELKISKQNVY